ncbi:MAG: Si-specific NAD(P)(+) transhydrogenase [Oligoflexia bacterium]|nr:Si-specific NAD(P)(+) transhydrogenase [Oligoflexia bacterium]
MKSFDLIVIGSGPAGQRGAIQAAKFGKRVALIEKETVFGGACIHTGTLPSKALRESIYNIYTFRLGGTELTRRAVREKVSFKELSARKDKVISNENEIISNAIRSNGISVYQGFGSFIDPTHVRIQTSEGGEIVIEGKYFLIATGSRPVRPAQIPFDDQIVCDSDSILNMAEIPESLTVIGGGVIGCEYASMFSALGVDVHLVDKKSDILPFMDQEITEVLKKSLISQGCRLNLGDEFVTIAKTSDGKVETTLKSGRKIKSTNLLYAMGRGPQTDKLNLKAAGVKTDDRGHILVNKNYVSDAPHIYAVGDVIGFPSLASSGFEQGRLAICHALNIPHGEFPDEFPYGIYTIPEISSVGKTEEELIASKTEYEVGRSEYLETARGQIIADSVGLLKICFCPKTHKIYGIHIIGNSASELIHLGQMVMRLGGDMRTLIRNIFNYPTLAEAYKIAAFNGLNKTFKDQEIRY